MSKKQRIYYWDNLKVFLIFLVVLGHFLIPVTSRGKSLECAYYYIYLFHMPAFVFVSGFFSKKYISKGKGTPDEGKIIGFLFLYIIYKLLIWGLNSILYGKISSFSLLEESGSPWYLFSMACWYLILPLFARFKAGISLGVSILFALYAGTVDAIGPFLCLSRTIVFFPFFLWGYYFKNEYLVKITCKKYKIVGGGILAGIALCVFYYLDNIKKYEGLLYGNRPYSILGNEITTINALGIRAFLYLVGAVMIISLMAWIPQRKLTISYIGSRTLSIYILHKLVRDAFSGMQIYDRIDFNGVKLLMLCSGISVIIVVALSPNIFNKFWSKFFKINYDKFLCRSYYDDIE